MPTQSIIHASLSTALMAVITTGLLLIILVICLANKKILIHAGYKLLALFVVFTVLRFLLPIEFPFTINIYAPDKISNIMAFCRARLFTLNEQPISLWGIFKPVWLAGFIIGLLSYAFSYYRTSKHIILYGKELTHTEPYKSLLEQICQNKGKQNRFRAIEIPGLAVPVLFGIIHPRILIPEKFDATKQQLNYILQHEATHHFHHDLVFKAIIKIITLAYWWDIFAWILNDQTEVIFEMRIDDSLTAADADITREYMECLIGVAEEASQKKVIPSSLTIGILPSDRKSLRQRFQLMSANQEKLQTKWSIGVMLTVAVIYISSYTFILEDSVPAWQNIAANPDLLAEDNFEDLLFPTAYNSYFIDNQDGTYDFYLNNEFWETVDTLEYHSSDIPVYTKDTVPQ